GKPSGATSSPLIGKLFDDQGERLTPSHAVKGNRRLNGEVPSARPIRLLTHHSDVIFETYAPECERAGDWMYGAIRAMCGGSREGAKAMKKGSKLERDPQKLAAELEQLRELNSEQLRERWQTLFGAEPPL